MKIVKFKAENFQKLKVVEITPEGNVVTIAGRCEQGKTTILDAIHAALGGGTMPEKPIREGEKKASIVLDLGEMTVTRTFTPLGSALKIENKDGFKASKPQDLLDRIVGKLAFDPLEFAKADQKKQVEMLLSVVDLKVDTAKLKSISGVEVIEEDSNPLNTLNHVYSEVAENRKLVNRQLDSAKKVLAELPDVEKVEEVSLVELVTEKERLEKINQQNNLMRESVNSQRTKVEQLSVVVDKTLNEITELERQLVAKKSLLETQRTDLNNAGTVLNDMKEAVKVLVDEDLTEINTKIANADQTNKQAQQFINRRAKQVELNKYQTESDNYTAKLKKIAEYKQEIVANTKFPVDGLDFAGGGVIYNGIPFKQASTAQALRVSTAIGMAINPKLRVMLIDGAECLDSTQMKIISEMAADQDYQLWLTRVTEDEKVGIYIEDGAIKEAVN